MSGWAERQIASLLLLSRIVFLGAIMIAAQVAVAILAVVWLLFILIIALLWPTGQGRDTVIVKAICNHLATDVATVRKLEETFEKNLQQIERGRSDLG